MKSKYKTIELSDKVEFETFRDIRGDYYISEMTADFPSCFNSMVAVRKYRVTIELVDEPIEIIQKRLQKLWDECKNHHDWNALQDVGKKYGLDLQFKF